MNKTILILSINIFFMIIFLVCQGISAWIIAPLYPGQAVDTWAGQSGERFAQLAAFFPESYGFNEKSVSETRDSIEKALLDVSLESRDERKLYADAWSASGSFTVTGQRGSSVATVIGVGGDYFLFHPLYLRSGSYISQRDFMRDRVVLDEDLAWRLYGGVNLEGLEVLINNRPFLIAGVAAREQGFTYARAMSIANGVSVEKAYESSAGLFMSFEALDALIRTAAPDTGESAGAWISSYEIVMPDVVTDFAVDSLTAAIDGNLSHIVDNTYRLSYTNLFNLLGSFGIRSLRTDAIVLPYWENAVRYAEDWLALLFGISLLVMICPAVFAVIYGVKLIRYGLGVCKRMINAQWKKREDRVYARYMRNLSH